MVSNANYPTWPGWETMRPIGRGSFGAVYEIQREASGETDHRPAKPIISDKSFLC